jgi:ATP-dependent Clp protease adapter protein ClpS
MFESYSVTMNAMGHGLVLPEIVETPKGTGRWMVVMYNNDTTPFEDVVAIVMRSTGCGANEAYIETWEAHYFGKAPCHFAERTECEVIASMISSIGVRTQVRREWED